MKSIRLTIQHFQVPNCTRHDFLMTFAFPDGDFSPHFSLDSVLAVSFLLPIRLYRALWCWMLKVKGMEGKEKSLRSFECSRQDQHLVGASTKLIHGSSQYTAVKLLFRLIFWLSKRLSFLALD